MIVETLNNLKYVPSIPPPPIARKQNIPIKFQLLSANMRKYF